MPYDQIEGYVPPTEEEKTPEEEEISSPNITHGTRLWALISLILSIVGAVLVIVPIVGVFFGAAGIIFAVISRKKNGFFEGLTVFGLIVGIIAFSSCGFFIAFNAMTEAGMVPNIFIELMKI